MKSAWAVETQKARVRSWALSRQWLRAWRARPRVASLLDRAVGVEAAVAPGDLLVVHGLVVDAVIDEGAQQAQFDPIEQAAGVDQVVVAQAQDVRLVGALRGGGEAEQEAGPEVLQQAPIDGGGGVVEFVHHDIVEVPGVEQGQVAAPTQGLDRGEEQVTPRPCARRCTADPRARAHALKARLGLEQDLFPVGDEQDAPGLDALAVEGGQDRSCRARSP